LRSQLLAFSYQLSAPVVQFEAPNQEPENRDQRSGKQGPVCADHEPLAFTLAPISGFIVRREGEIICKTTEKSLDAGGEKTAA
jgi:hypothetical protein